MRRHVPTPCPRLSRRHPRRRVDAVRRRDGGFRVIAHQGPRSVEGVRENQLVGYGLVVGLNGTGDTLNNSPFTKQSLQAMLERLGVNTRGANLRTANVAAVMVTANLPAFAHAGHAHRRHRLGARRRQEPAGRHAAGHPAARRRRRGLRRGAGLGGDLRLHGRGRRRHGDSRRADRRPHRHRRARSSARSASSSRSLKHAAAGPAQSRPHHRPPRSRRRSTTSSGADTAEPTDPSTVRDPDPAALPRQHRRTCSPTSSSCASSPTRPAKVVIDERSGIIVMGKDVRVSTVAVAQGNLTVTITGAAGREPAGRRSSNGETAVVPRTGVKVDTGSGNKLACRQGRRHAAASWSTGSTRSASARAT